jgi:urocanate reductase
MNGAGHQQQTNKGMDMIAEKLEKTNSRSRRGWPEAKGRGATQARLSRMPGKWDQEADLIVVGTGFSGLAAALTAGELGLHVLLLEKMGVPGGNSIIAGGGANAVDPVRQKRQGIEDSHDLHFRQTMAGGDHINDPEKVRYLVEHALEDGVHYLERLGVSWPAKVVRGFGSLYERTHYVGAYTDRNGKTWRRGAANIRAMLDELHRVGQDIRFRHKITGLIREQPLAGRVLGVEVDIEGTRHYFKAAQGVILASGGFGANLEWVVKHDRRLAHTGTSNHKGATGECIKFAEDIGADTLHMDYIQAIPHEVRPPVKAMFFQIESEEVRRASASMPYRIFVNKQGKRFVDEGARRDVIKFAGCAQTVFTPQKKIRAASIAELEGKLGLPEGRLVETVDQYNSLCETGRDGEFGKDSTLLVPLKTGPFLAVSKAILRHHTMGGLLVKGTTGQVIDRWGEVIPGLFAAGEVTGGTHGANRLGHNATADCLVFGQLCAKTAAQGEPNPLS